MGLQCREIQTQQVCFTNAVGVEQGLIVHYEYAMDTASTPHLPYIVAHRYTTIDGAPFDTSLGTVVTGPCCCSASASANGEDIPDSTTGWIFPGGITQVRTFTVSNHGSTDIVVNFTLTRSMLVHAGASKTWGTGDGADFLNVSTVTIDTGTTSNADVIWEEV